MKVLFSIIDGDIGVFSGTSFEEVNRYIDMLPEDFIIPVEAQEMEDGVFELRFYRKDGADIDANFFSSLMDKGLEDQPRDEHGRWTDGGGSSDVDNPEASYNRFNSRPPSVSSTTSSWKTLKDGTKVNSVFSKDNTKRYSLTNVWDKDKKVAQLIMFNPSTADTKSTDATTRRLRSELSKQGFGAIHIVNLYSARASKPSALKNLSDKDKAMVSIGQYLNPKASVTIAAWGGLGAKSSTGVQHLQQKREDEVIKELKARNIKLKAFATTKAGDPVHPIYQKRDPNNPRRMLGYGSLDKMIDWKPRRKK